MTSRFSRWAFATLVLLAFAAFGIVPFSSTQGQGPGPGDTTPDISVSGILLSDDSPMEDDTITIRATIQNNETMAVGNITVLFLLDGTAMANVTNVSVDANAAKVVETTWKAVKSDHTITAIISVGGKTQMTSARNITVPVEPKPIGDLPTVAGGLAFVIIVVVGTALIPGLSNRFKNGQTISTQQGTRIERNP